MRPHFSPLSGPATGSFNGLHVKSNFLATKELRLVVTDADDGIAADHADWVDAGFIIGTEK